MINCDNNLSITLEQIVKDATIDLGEDYTKVKVTFQSFALRGLKEISAQILNLNSKNALLPIQKNFNLVTLPGDCKQVTFVGFIDSCNEKQPFLQNYKIVNNVEKKELTEVCTPCENTNNVCEDLIITQSKVEVSINNVLYYKTIITKKSKNTILILSNIPVLDVASNTVKYIDLEEIQNVDDVEACNAPSNTNNTENKCLTCIDCSQNTDCGICDKCKYSKGYNIFYESNIIKFNWQIPNEYVYIEYKSVLPKNDDGFIVPEVAKETLIAFVKFKYKQEKKSVSRQDKMDAREDYIIAKKNMIKIMGKFSSSELDYAVHKIPQFKAY